MTSRINLADRLALLALLFGAIAATAGLLQAAFQRITRGL